MDRLETNFRLLLISQRETETGLRVLAGQVGTLATQVGGLVSQVVAVADSSKETSDRLEETISVMKSFADGQVEVRVEQAEMRATLADCMRRLDALEERKAS